MAAPTEDLRSPFLANVVTLLGFALIFTTFATDSAWSWIIGGVLLVAGALWAGFGPGRPAPGGADVPAVEGARAVREGAEPPAEPESGRRAQSDGHPG